MTPVPINPNANFEKFLRTYREPNQVYSFADLFNTHGAGEPAQYGNPDDSTYDPAKAQALQGLFGAVRHSGGNFLPMSPDTLTLHSNASDQALDALRQVGGHGNPEGVDVDPNAMGGGLKKQKRGRLITNPGKGNSNRTTGTGY